MPTSASQGRSPDRREAILNAALDLFAKQGYDGTSIEDIGRAVNITGPAIYRHFHSKEQILVVAFENAGTEMVRGFETSRGLPPRQAFDVLARSHATMAVKHGGWVRIWLRERHRLPRRFGTTAYQVQLDYVAWFAEVIGRLRPDLSDAERRETVHVVLGLLNGAAYYRSSVPDTARIDFLVDAARSVVNGAPLSLDPPAGTMRQ